jgi:hypothetical protein
MSVHRTPFSRGGNTKEQVLVPTTGVVSTSLIFFNSSECQRRQLTADSDLKSTCAAPFLVKLK